MLLALALVLAPASLLLPDARSDPDHGTPRDWCESFWDEAYVHEYSSFGYWERVQTDDFFVGYAHTAIPRHDGSRGFSFFSCPLGDGHFEFAIGGALLSGMGGSANGGSETCLGEVPHHSWLNWPTIYVEDAVFGTGVDFTVLSDWPNAGQEALFPCGDGILEPCPVGGPNSGCNPADEWIYGFGGSVQAPFDVGANGAYYVFVEGTSGHVWT